ncbi:MAG TPA: molybdate ABC transporter substrate-binding protein [Micropepsaceae bacterium]|jgi:molybdate transport system substrate-binding protein|nr:molybdate ABC transporter substrate-binding protein [Micropepsaceae bacterium]
MKHLIYAALTGLVLSGSANAAEVTLIAPGGIRAAVEQMIPAFEKKTGHTVKATFGSGNGTKAQVTKGEAFDVPIVQPPYPEVLASGNVVTGSETPLAHVSVGLAVRPGTPHPDISNPEAVKKLFLSAKSISYPDPKGGAAAGVSMNETLKKLGISEQMQSKIKLAQGGAGAMKMLADGQVEFGLTFVSEIITEPGVEVVGPLPEAVSTPTRLSGFVGAHAKDPAAAKALLAYLSSDEAAKVYKERGMVPGR